jgi:hypothetical protein
MAAGPAALALDRRARGLLRQGGWSGAAARWLCVLLCAGLATQLLEWRRQMRRLREVQRRLGVGRAHAVSRARRFVRARLVTVAALTQQQLERQLEGALDGFAARLGARLKDPAMPAAVQRAVDALLASLLPDIKQECWRWTDERFLPMISPDLRSGYGGPSEALSPLVPTAAPLAAPTPRFATEPAGGGGAPLPPHTPLPRPRFAPGLRIEPPSSPPHSPSPPPHPPPPSSHHLPLRYSAALRYPLRYSASLLRAAGRSAVHQLRRCRAQVLHTLWPCDRSLWASLRSPAWWLLQALGHMPFIGQAWWLVLALVVDRRDEYQLCAFVVGLRVSHFVGLGLGAASYACVQAYRCTLAAAAAAQPPDDTGGGHRSTGGEGRPVDAAATGAPCVRCSDAHEAGGPSGVGGGQGGGWDEEPAVGQAETQAGGQAGGQAEGQAAGRSAGQAAEHTDEGGSPERRTVLGRAPAVEASGTSSTGVDAFSADVDASSGGGDASSGGEDASTVSLDASTVGLDAFPAGPGASSAGGDASTASVEASGECRSDLAGERVDTSAEASGECRSDLAGREAPVASPTAEAGCGEGSGSPGDAPLCATPQSQTCCEALFGGARRDDEPHPSAHATPAGISPTCRGSPSSDLDPIASHARPTVPQPRAPLPPLDPPPPRVPPSPLVTPPPVAPSPPSFSSRPPFPPPFSSSPPFFSPFPPPFLSPPFAAPSDAARRCVSLAPHLHPWAAGFWLLQLWLSIYAVGVLLPRTAKKGARVPMERRHRLPLAPRLHLAAGDYPAAMQTMSRHPPNAGSSLSASAGTPASSSFASLAYFSPFASPPTPSPCEPSAARPTRAASSPTRVQRGRAPQGGTGSTALGAACHPTTADVPPSAPREGLGTGLPPVSHALSPRPARATEPADPGLLRGGLLPRLGRLDACLAALVMLSALAACVLFRGEQRSATLFWIRTAHGLFSAPYLLFKLPLLDTLLTHARKTGYDRHGHTVPFRAVAAPRAPVPAPPVQQGSPSGRRRLFALEEGEGRSRGRGGLFSKLITMRVW